MPDGNSSTVRRDSVDCSVFRTCTKCAGQPACSWTMEKQICARRTPRAETQRTAAVDRLTALDESDCPRFSAVSRSAAAGVYFVYKVNISNDAMGFGAFLNNTVITCCLETCDVEGLSYNDQIVCMTAKRAPLSIFTPTKRMVVYNFRVVFGNVTLRYDDEADNYFTVYNRDCGHTADEECATCAWTDAEYAYFLKLCSRRNPCTGSYRLYKKKYADNSRRTVAVDNRPVRLACPDVISVRSVNPLYALWSGRTTMMIRVVNHRILVENRTMAVTVAGRDCSDPWTLDEETVVCTVLPLSSDENPSEPPPDEGPVLVTYVSSPGFTVTSSQTVKLVRPAVTAVRPSCGPSEGGTRLTVTGEYLNASRSVRVTIGDDNSTCQMVEPLSEDRITCVTGPGRVDAAGTVRVEFDGGRFVADHRGPTIHTFEYADSVTPEPEQRFGGIASGGTAIPVRVSAVRCPYSATIDVLNGTATSDCNVITATYIVCPSPKIDLSKLPPGPLPKTVAMRFSTAFATEHSKPYWLSGWRWFEYVVYPDPVYADFELAAGDRSALVINGRDLDRGTGVADVAVRFRRNSTGAACAVASMTRHEIVCESSVPRAVLEDLVRPGIVVTVGDSLSYELWKKPAAHDSPRATDVAIVSMVAVALVFSGVTLLFLCRRIMHGNRRRTFTPTVNELQLLDDTQQTAL